MDLSVLRLAVFEFTQDELNEEAKNDGFPSWERRVLFAFSQLLPNAELLHLTRVPIIRPDGTHTWGEAMYYKFPEDDELATSDAIEKASEASISS